MKFLKDKKGFSFIELVIAMIIMVALVAGAAVTMTGYVEKSRASTDVNTIDSVVNAVETLGAEYDFEGTITINGGATINDGSNDLAAGDEFYDALNKIVKVDDLKLTSKGLKSIDVVLTVDMASDGSTSIVVSAANIATDAALDALTEAFGNGTDDQFTMAE